MNSIKSLISLTVVLAITLMIAACSSQEKVDLGDDFLEKAHASVQGAYGDDYIPSMSIEAGFLEEIYGIPMNLVTDYIAEGPMMSTHIDTFIGLEVDQGSVNEVADALSAYHKDLIENSMQYPMNMAKVQSAEVLVVENYVFFLMLGGFDDEATTEEEALKFAEQQVQIAVKTIEGLVK